MGLVLFDLDGTVLNDDGAAVVAVEQGLAGAGWVDAEGVAGLVWDWDEIAARHFAGLPRSANSLSGSVPGPATTIWTGTTRASPAGSTGRQVPVGAV